jgi:hypothetical protein
MPPAVKGLKPAMVAAGQAGVIEFAGALAAPIGASETPPEAASMSYAEAAELGRAAQALRAADPMMSLPEAVRRVMGAQQRRQAQGRAAGEEGADPVELARRARDHQARLAELGLALTSAAAVRAVLDRAAVA